MRVEKLNTFTECSGKHLVCVDHAKAPPHRRLGQGEFMNVERRYLHVRTRYRLRLIDVIDVYRRKFGINQTYVHVTDSRDGSRCLDLV
jgi:hypothetical protein